MPNITFSVSIELYKRMKKYPEIKWSTLYRRMIKNYLDKLEQPNIRSISEIREELRKKNITLEDIPLDKAIETFRKMRELEWKRSYSTRTG